MISMEPKPLGTGPWKAGGAEDEEAKDGGAEAASSKRERGLLTRTDSHASTQATARSENRRAVVRRLNKERRPASPLTKRAKGAWDGDESAIKRARQRKHFILSSSRLTTNMARPHEEQDFIKAAES